MTTPHIVLLVCCTIICAVSAALCYWSVGVLRDVGSDVKKYLEDRIDDSDTGTHP